MIDLFLKVWVLTMSLFFFNMCCYIFLKQKIVKALVAFIVGLLFSVLGLYSAFSVIEQVGNASPSIVAGG